MKKSNAKEKICGLASYAVLAVLTVAACWFFAGIRGEHRRRAEYLQFFLLWAV